jgi:hypothetical protein
VSSPRFQNIDETNIDDHTRILASDRVIFLREYTAQKGFAFSDTNNLISNLKKKKGDGGFHYKARAVDQCATEIFNGLNPDWLKTACLVPIPPSKCKTDEAFDDRVLRICNGIAAKAPFPVDVREIITQADSLRAAHESSDRPSVEELMSNYELDETLCANPPDVIGIVDDVLTVGNHFRAMSNKLARRFPDAWIVGIFVARRAIPHDNFDDFDDLASHADA